MTGRYLWRWLIVHGIYELDGQPKEYCLVYASGETKDGGAETNRLHVISTSVPSNGDDQSPLEGTCKTRKRINTWSSQSFKIHVHFLRQPYFRENGLWSPFESSTWGLYNSWSFNPGLCPNVSIKFMDLLLGLFFNSTYIIWMDTLDYQQHTFNGTSAAIAGKLQVGASEIAPSACPDNK